MDKPDRDFLKAAALRDIGLALNACHNTVTTDGPDAEPAKGAGAPTTARRSIWFTSWSAPWEGV